jgi:helicase
VTILPEWLDYVHYERAAASMLRRLNGPSSSWGELLASGQSVMSHYNDDLSINAIESLYDEQRALPLIAASRILDAASQHGELDSEGNIRLGLTAAVAYGMYGNFLSATAVIRRLKERHQDRVLRDVHYAVAISTVAPKFLSELLAVCEENSVQAAFLEKLEQYLVEGKASLEEGVRSLMVDCILGADSSFKGSLLRSARISLEHLFNLSVSRVLGDHCQDLSQRYIGKLTDSGVRVFLPPQFHAISNNKLITSPENSLVSLPTSTGKTLLGELCIVNALAQPGLACFLAPYVALGSQVMASFEKHIPNDVRKHLMVGGFRPTKQLDPINHRELIVATPERLDALLRLNSDLIPHITCIVCDEAHLIQSGPRGLRLEGLLTRLRLLQRNGNGLRLILLSAVLSDYPRIQSWLDIPSEQLVTSEWRPTAGVGILDCCSF